MDAAKVLSTSQSFFIFVLPAILVLRKCCMVGFFFFKFKTVLELKSYNSHFAFEKTDPERVK